MKRLHVHLSVENLSESIHFYSTLFAAEPTVSKPDYAKWMLDDPRVNFAISQRGAILGLNHLGVQVESADELAEMRARLEGLHAQTTPEMGAACCYAKSDKYWTDDPQGIVWEAFHTLDSIPIFGGDAAKEAVCCIPLANAVQQAQASSSCCPEKTDSTPCC